MTIYYILIAAASIYFFIISLSNILFLKRATQAPSLREGPKISVLIPARNEENNIRQCLTSLLRQTYTNYEIIVLDDLSTDSTYEIVAGMAAEHSNLSIIKGEELPEGWYGKPHAMQQLSKHASGDFFLFTDADTIHSSESISWSITNMLHHKADILSGYPHHTTEGFGEDLVIPNIYINTILFLPLWMVPTTHIPLFSHAIGQYILFRRESFEAIGGYEVAAQKITEDVYMAKAMKRRGYKVQFLDAKRYCSCRMYDGFQRAANGISKNIYDFFEQKLYPLFILIPFALLFFIVPVALLVYQAIIAGPYLYHAGISVGVFFITWAIAMIDRRVKWYVVFLHPLMFLVLVGIAVKSVLDDTLGRGYLWKGRFVR
jgi:chlorobactene glucosyltransferase